MLSDQAAAVQLASRMGLVHPLLHDIDGLPPVPVSELTPDQAQVKRAVARYSSPIVLVLGDPQAALTMALAEMMPASSFIVADPWESDETYNAAIATIYPQRTRILPLASDMQRMPSWRLPPLGLIVISDPERIADIQKVVDDAWSMLGRGGVLAAARGNGVVAAMRILGVGVSNQRGKATLTAPRRDGQTVVDIDGRSANLARSRQKRTEAPAKGGRGGRDSKAQRNKASKGNRPSNYRIPRDDKALPIRTGSEEMTEQHSNKLLKFKHEWDNRKAPESDLRLG